MTTTEDEDEVMLRANRMSPEARDKLLRELKGINTSSEQEFMTMRITGGTLEILNQLGADPEDPHSVEQVLREKVPEHLFYETEGIIISAINSTMGEYKAKMPVKRMMELHHTLLNFAEKARVAAIEMLLQEGFTCHVAITDEHELDEHLKGYA